MRLASASYGSPCHDGSNWDFVRRQLLSARASWPSGEAPPLPLLASELAQLDAHARATGHPPIAERGRGRWTYDSFREDLRRSRLRAGEEVIGLSSPALDALQEALAAAEPPDAERWSEILRYGRELADVLERPAALAGALSDLLTCAAGIDADDDLMEFADRLDTFRSVAEFQGNRWKTIQNAVTYRLTVRETDPRAEVIGGRFVAGTPLDEVLDDLRQRLTEPLGRRSYAVWIATLAGPGGLDERHPTVVGNGIAVCGVACQGDVERWLAEVRTALAEAYRQRDLRVPLDVSELGEPSFFDGQVLSEGTDLWREMGQPPSFVSRVEVIAASGIEAQAHAHAALKAVFSRMDTSLANDIRSDSWIWTHEDGWGQPQSTARGLSLGELNAARTAGAAVENWTADFSTPLDRDDVRRMQARALVNDAEAPAELRLMRGVASLETFYRHDRTFAALERLWLRWAFEVLRRDFNHLLWNVALGRPNGDGPSTRDGWEALQRNRDALRGRLAAGGWTYGRRLFDAIGATLQPMDPGTASRAWIRAFGRQLEDPEALRQARSAHRAACRRAQRHRNLVVHGWHVSDDVLRSSADFIAMQLELAVVARAAAGRAGGALVGFDGEPDKEWMERTPEELFDAVAATRG